MLSSIDFNFSIKIGCCVGSCYPYTSDYFLLFAYVDCDNGDCCVTLFYLDIGLFLSIFKPKRKAGLPRRVGWPKRRVPIGTRPLVRVRNRRAGTGIRCNRVIFCGSCMSLECNRGFPQSPCLGRL